MSLAQRLYEGRNWETKAPWASSPTCGVTPPGFGRALDAVRSFIDQTYGGEYLPQAPNRFKSPKGAQEAHRGHPAHRGDPCGPGRQGVSQQR